MIELEALILRAVMGVFCRDGDKRDDEYEGGLVRRETMEMKGEGWW
jgi:hypothetical protein